MSTFDHPTRAAWASVFVFFLMMQFALAGSGSIVGRVVDKTAGAPLPGANVVIQGTSIGGSTDLDGRYALKIVPPGTQSVRVSYVGYGTATLEVTVDENATSTRDFLLFPQAVQGEAVEVTAQAKGQLSAINQQLSSNSIINVVSSDKMKELPDANIAESIGRLPGISLQRNGGEAFGVVIRGLSPKFNQVTIEGIPMNSTNYYDRAIDLSLMTDELVRSVEVSKTLRPDMDADALGGTVNLTLNSADPGLHYSMAGLGAYNNLRDSYHNYKFSGSVSDRFLNDQVGILAQGSIEQKQLPSDQFSADYDAPTFQSTNGTFYINTNSATLTELSLNRHRYGASLILDYASDLVDVKLFNVYDQKRDSTISRTYTSNFRSNSFQYNIYANETKTEQRTHSLLALFQLGGTELPVSLSYTKGNQTTPNGMEFDFLQTNVPALSSSLVIYGDPAQLIHVQGVMDPGSENSTLYNMLLTNTNLTDESYDAKLDWRVPFKLSDSYSGKLSVGGKYHDVTRASTNARLMYLVDNSEGRKSKLIDEFPFLYGTKTNPGDAGLPAGSLVDPKYTRTDILGYPIGPGYDVGKLTEMMNGIYPAWQSLFYRDGPACFYQEYTDKENTAAGYVMGEFDIGSNLTIVPGVRYQDEQTDISAYHIQLNYTNPNGLAGQPPVLVESKRKASNWFPSVNVKYRATENIQVLGAVFRNHSLPSFGDIYPMVEYSSNPPFVVTGNPLLRPSTAWNFDLGFTLSSNDIGLVRVNLFYKEISDLIYGMQSFLPFWPYAVVGAPADIYDRLPGPGSGYYDNNWAQANNTTNLAATIPMNDPSKAYLRGIEISWQTHLWYLPGVLSRVVLDLNASYLSSRRQYPSFTLVRAGGTIFKPIYNLVYQTVEGPLQDQPRAIYNAILGWDYLGFSSRFSLRYQQLTLTSMDTQYGLRNSYYDNVLLFDISLKQQVIGNLYLFANATNVNSHIDNYYYSHPAFAAVPEGQLPTSRQTYGWEVQLGLSFNY